MGKTCNIAIILAGGSGSRAAAQATTFFATTFATTFAAHNNKTPRPATPPSVSSVSRPKQFWPLGGRPLWQHSWLRYASHPGIDKVCLVWPEAYVKEIRAAVSTFPEPVSAGTYVIAGGAERSDSSYRALEFCQQWQVPRLRIQVFIHDAARPLFSRRMITESLAQLQVGNAVVCAIPTQDSLLTKDTAGKVGRVLDRSCVMRSQTPQSFELQTLRRAFALHRQQAEIRVTDDISLVKHYLPDSVIHIVRGENYNVKLTDIMDWHTLTAFYPTFQSLEKLG
ncbi:MAG: 2-C-methyl-D-erythritol 4-phosphate cytidylyltransferase [Spirochaetota bacterium]